jgi:Ni,Fe-hydrogenase I cytochrome b subunit
MMSGIEDEGTDILPADQEKFEWIMSASIVLTAVAVYYLGFLYVLPVATLALTYYLTRNTVRSVLVTILFTVGFLLLFEVVLGTRIFEGIWFK